MCGEKGWALLKSYELQGSPPRVRGKAVTKTGSTRQPGITPACAGKRPVEPAPYAPGGDHPRVCGEKTSEVRFRYSARGSPPRVRGKGAYCGKVKRYLRITPACAGKSFCPATTPTSTWDHPRVCGEKPSPRQGVQDNPGSPPRVRGKVAFTVISVDNTRITPACAGKSFPLRLTSRFNGDHPRVCGEKSISDDQRAYRLGSPPRVRGKGYVGGMISGALGITPACAGKSLTASYLYQLWWDHPRVCGEKCPSFLIASQTPGSPPRVRGKALSAAAKPATSGITPACAGKRLFALCRLVFSEDHPRVCGEKALKLIKQVLAMGSPPRVRGKGPVCSGHNLTIRITPACAGKSMMVSSYVTDTWDHPRVCGEKRNMSTSMVAALGSPPRVRGKVTYPKTSGTITGITPACAGKSGSITAARPYIQDHPRVCGEKIFTFFIHLSFLGSPPRVRGKEKFTKRKTALYRITPACAGKSLFRISCSSSARDHPRVCGEKLAVWATFFGLTGSPPRVRGKAIFLLLFHHFEGITPACAGKRGQGGDQGRCGRDHPRVCGEKKRFGMDDLYFKGSPPRVRGKAEVTFENFGKEGITPACAGKRLTAAAPNCLSRDHPRVCGEKSVGGR